MVQGTDSKDDGILKEVPQCVLLFCLSGIFYWEILRTYMADIYKLHNSSRSYKIFYDLITRT